MNLGGGFRARVGRRRCTAIRGRGGWYIRRRARRRRVGVTVSPEPRRVAISRAAWQPSARRLRDTLASPVAAA